MLYSHGCGNVLVFMLFLLLLSLVVMVMAGAAPGYPAPGYPAPGYPGMAPAMAPGYPAPVGYGMPMPAAYPSTYLPTGPTIVYGGHMSKKEMKKMYKHQKHHHKRW
jgi:hypothetical protein